MRSGGIWERLFGCIARLCELVVGGFVISLVNIADVL